MKGLLISILWKLVLSLVGHGVGSAVLALVRDTADLEIPGDEKRQRVLSGLKELRRIGAVSLIEVSESLINLAVEAAVQRARMHGP